MKLKTNQKVLASLSLILIVLLIGTVGYYQQVIAGFEGSQASLPFYIGAPQPYSYVIDTNGTHYFMYNGTTGKLDFQSTNVNTVFQNGKDSLTDGGAILFKVGNYDDVHFSLDGDDDDITIYGEGKATKLLQSNNSRDIITVQGTPDNYVERIVIRDLYMEGAGTQGSQEAIRCISMNDSIIENNYIYNIGCDTDANPSAIFLIASNHNTIRGNTINTTTWIGIGTWDCSYNIYELNHISNVVNNGIDLNGRAEGINTLHNSIISNTISYTGMDGIALDAPDYTLVANNHMVYTVGAGINIGYDALGSTVIGNYIYYAGSNGITCFDTHNALLSDNTIIGSTDNAMYFENVSDIAINDVYIEGWGDGGPGGIWLENVQNVTVSGGIILGNETLSWYGVMVGYSKYVSIGQLFIKDMGTGIALVDSNYTQIVGVMFIGCNDTGVVEYGLSDYTLLATSTFALCNIAHTVDAEHSEVYGCMGDGA